jgi:antitoxin (DNA-binding transcriptional repressor) of toxin-antitoxin stability system
MRTVNVHEAKTHVFRLIDAAHAAETILGAKGGWCRSSSPRRAAGPAC